MKKIIIPVFIASISMFSLSCKKSEDAKPYTCQTCKTTPDALAANNTSSKGIYKGIVIGSSGTIMFDILNAGTTITATFVLDGVSTTLTSNVTWVAGVSYIGAFTGTLNGAAISITFSVGSDGTNPTVTAFNIPGHPNSTFTIVKETSQNLVECFEGTYHSSKPEDGTFNLLLSRTAKIYGGSSRKLGSNTSNNFDGIITSTNGLKDNSNGTVMATLNGDVITGSFQDGSNNTVNLTANRTW